MAIADLTTSASGHAPALVAALLHSLWQAALLASMCKVALLVIPCRRPNWRYGITLASLATVVVLFLVTLRLQTHQPSPSAVAPAPLPVAPSGEVAERATPPANIPPAAPPTSLEWSTTPPSSAPTWQTALGCLWLAGVLLMLFRAARILHGEKRIAGTARPVNDPATLALLDELRTRFRIARRVLIATVDTACSPAVVGIVTPVILVPTAILTGSSPDHLRAILAHELAHIRRWDVLINVLQLLVESLFFHNPFVWLLSAQIRHEREACCDAVAADCCGGAPAYARVLVDVGQRVLAANAAVSFAHPNSLSDRVRRLLGLRPTGDTWRLPVASLVIGLIAGISAILVVAQGTFKATDAILTATERIELIEQTVAEQAVEAKSPVGRTHYIGRVGTADGRALPQGMRMHVNSAAVRGRTTAGFCDVRPIDPESGQFDIAASGTWATLWLWAPGYTPWFEGPMVPGPKPVTDTGEWLLEPQTPLTIRVLDDRGKPLPNAKVGASWHPARDVTCGGTWTAWTTDIAGECVVPLVTEYPMSLGVKAPGFERARLQNLNPPDDRPVVFRLTRSIPLVLRVLEKDTGSPIAGARVRLLAQVEEMADHRGSQPEDAPVVGTSGTDGVCMVRDLHRKGEYWLIVDARGHGPELVERATPGDRLDVHLGPPRIVRGTVTGNLDRLRMRKANPYLDISCRIRHKPNHLKRYRFLVPVQVRNGTGTFETDQLWPGDFTIDTGGNRVEFSTKPGETEVNVELAAPEGRREIRLAFTPREDALLPRGTVRVYYQAPKDSYADSYDLPVEHGVVAFLARTGHQIRYDPQGVVGGWFRPGETRAIPAGEGPHTIRIPFVPAGAIAISLIEADGSPADGFIAHVREITKSPHRGKTRFGVEGKNWASHNDGVFAYTATPLPLGGTYEVVASRGFTYVTTGPIRLTEKCPLYKRQLVLAGDATIRGQVVDPSGTPLPGVAVGFQLPLAGSQFGVGDIKADANGRFKFPGVVSHPGVKYQITARPKRGFVPRRVYVTDLDKPLRIVTKPGMALSGRVLDEKDGTPLCDLAVFLYRETIDREQRFVQFGAEALTDRKGNFRFSNLLPGTYSLHGSEVSTGNRPRVKAGQAKPVIWRVPKPH